MNRNLQTALGLAVLALTTLIGIIAKYWLLGG